MIFEWPLMLWCLLLVPLAVLGYASAMRRREAMAGHAKWSAPVAPPPRSKRWLPPVLFFLALTALLVAVARPVAVIPLATFRDRVILAVDVSNSMTATDMQPTRLGAAQAAARDFIDKQPTTTQIGVVAFAGTALQIQRPTFDREQLLKAIDKLEPQEGTAVGGAIQVALQSLFPKENFELKRPEEQPDPAKPLVGPQPADPAEAVPRAPGSEDSAAIILLTDGQATTGPDPVEIAKLAADRGVRVFTVGVGTAEGEVVKSNGISMRVEMDEETLKKIADITLSRYFLATSETDLRDVYKDLSARLTTETRELEITAFLVAFASVAVLLGAGLSLAWFNRIL